MKKTLWLFFAILVGLASCSKGYSGYDGDYASPADKAVGTWSAQGRPGGKAGVLTAGEWNDLDNWGFWSSLMESETYRDISGLWRFYTPRRVAVRLADASGNRLPGVEVKLQQGQQTLWTTRTDNFGEASLWVEPFQAQADMEGLSLVIGGVPQAEAPKVTAWNVQQEQADVNFYTLPQGVTLENRADIAFIVDATGSMGDEIAFLKKDLQNILERVKGGVGQTSLRTGAVFYRDKGDKYVTKSFDFSDDYRQTIRDISMQSAEGGGDLPEAVHTALEAGLQELNWNASARARIAFLVLDAPAHRDQQGVIESLQTSLRNYASLGIKLIPVFCSSPSKECEFMCRFFAILTGGTYVFLTDDSGVGGDHIEASVGEFQVEPLNDLLVRLIAKYIG